MRSSAAVALAVPLALAGACSTRDPDTRPFRIQATRSSTGGGSLLAEFQTGRAFSGTGRVVDPGTLVVEGTTLAAGLLPEDVTITFDRSAAPEVAFSSARLDGKAVLVLLAADPGYTGPGGEPLPVYELLVATPADPYIVNELVLAERVFPTERDTEVLPRNVVFEDVPWFTAQSDWAEFEPAECGLAYYDVVFVNGDDEEFPLRRGEQRQVAVLPRVQDPPQDDRPAWNVLHVVSWHRQGACAGQAKAWTQVAAWR